MKRLLLIIAICLLLGAVVNVAVAWGCAAWAPSPARQEAEGNWPARVPVEWGNTCSLYIGSNLGVMEVHALGRSLVGGGLPRQYVFQSGFPVRCLYRELRGIKDLGESLAAAEGFWSPRSWRGGIEISKFFQWLHVRQTRYLPAQPMWWGFLLNTFFYASVVWLLIPGPFALRRFLRVRRGLCQKCAYPMGESAICSECGKPLAKRGVG